MDMEADNRWQQQTAGKSIDPHCRNHKDFSLESCKAFVDIHHLAL